MSRLTRWFIEDDVMPPCSEPADSERFAERMNDMERRLQHLSDVVAVVQRSAHDHMEPPSTP